mgnify:CR=1 FL=1
MATMVPHLDGVITGREIGPGLKLDGEEIDGRVVVRADLGRGLYFSADGRINAIGTTAHRLDWFDWAVIVWVWGLALIGGFILGRAGGELNRQVAWAVLSAAVLFAAGWAAHYVWRHRGARQRRPRTPS